MITIYKYTSPSNKVYIGQTCKPTQAQRAGFQGSQYRGCPAFWNAIQKYGWDNFTYEVLEIVENRTAANEREQYYIVFYQSNNPLYGYNINAGGYDSSNFEYLQRLQDIKTMWDQGATVKEIKDKYKLLQQTLAYELTQLGINGKERIKRSAGQYRAKTVYQYNQQKELIINLLSIHAPRQPRSRPSFVCLHSFLAPFSDLIFPVTLLFQPQCFSSSNSSS